MPLTGYGADAASQIGGFCKNDFLNAMSLSGISTNVAERIIQKFSKFKKKWFEVIDESFLSQPLKDRYKSLIEERQENKTR